MSKQQTTQFEQSLKSIETENWLDRVFYRKIGFIFAARLVNTGITPNQVTVASFFVGMIGALLFAFEDWRLTIGGILLFVAANIMDCIDGQLARLTGIKSKLGRILDGFAGDIWFTTLYLSLFYRVLELHPGWYWFILIALVSGLSHGRQANITDYYKTFHLFLISKKKGYEFENHQQLETEYQQIDRQKEPVLKFFMYFYRSYTAKQEITTPELQRFLNRMRELGHDDIPDKIRNEFRTGSTSIMPLLDMMTFNGRTPLLFATGLFGFPALYLYFFYEIIVLNVIRIVAIGKHEALCKRMNRLLEDEK